MDGSLYAVGSSSADAMPKKGGFLAVLHRILDVMVRADADRFPSSVDSRPPEYFKYPLF